MTLRWIPAVYSPVRAGAIASGSAAALGIASDERAHATEMLAATFSAADVVLTDSGTSALVLAFRATGTEGRTVAMPGYACIDLIAAAKYSRMRVRFYDLDPATLSPDLASLEQALSRGADVVVTAPLFGYPIDMRSVMEIARARGVPVIEDAAQSAGSTLDGQRLGTFGDVSVLSFGRGKGTTGGSGGALLIRNRGEKIGALPAPGAGWRDVAVLGAQWFLARPSLYGIPASMPGLKLGEMVYHAAHEPGAMSRAAVRGAVSALRDDAREVARRKERAAQIIAMSASATRFRPVQEVAHGAAGFLRLAFIDSASAGHAAPRLGVMRPYPIALADHAESRSVIHDHEIAGPGARVLRDRLITVPTHSRTSRADVERVVGFLRDSRATGAAPVLAAHQ